jgi:hypothetical protein
LEVEWLEVEWLGLLGVGRDLDWKLGRSKWRFQARSSGPHGDQSLGFVLSIALFPTVSPFPTASDRPICYKYPMGYTWVTQGL